MAKRCGTPLAAAFSLLLLLVSPLFGQEQPLVASQAIVPVIGSVMGYGGGEWRNDVIIRNDTGAEASVILSMTAAPNEPFLMVTLQPGESSLFVDIARQAFGTTGVLSPLVIQTLGSRSVTVAATAYSVRPEGNSDPQLVTVLYGSSVPYFTTLTPLSVNDTFRTNVGFVNNGDATAVFVLSLQLIPGRNLARGIYYVPPRSMRFVSAADLFPLFPSGSDFGIVVEHVSPSSYSFASVVANDSDRGVFIPPR